MRILITAGGTREYIDPVRFISNASSGKMGYALARAAIEQGHQVTLITTVSLDSRINNQVKTVMVESADEMFDAVKKHFDDCDALIMAAAVADYKPARQSKSKIKKSNDDLVIKLKPTPDILKWAGKHKNKNTRKVVIGFALEDKNIRKNAEKKLIEKNLDMIIANDTSAIGNNKSTIYIKTPDANWIVLENSNKTSTAKQIIKIAATLQGKD